MGQQVPQSGLKATCKVTLWESSGSARNELAVWGLLTAPLSPSCPDACTEHCAVAVSPPAPMSRRVTKGHPCTPCPFPFHGDHAALCHKEP